MRSNLRSFLSTIFTMCCVLFVTAQTFSPYSQFGLGTQSNPAFSSNRAMGGISAGYSHSRTINFVNPASYADLNYTVFTLGAQMRTNVVSDTAVLTESTNGGVNHFAFGFPVIQNKWGLSFGLLPYSNVNYKFGRTSVFDDITYTESTQGSGSTYQFYIGNGLKFGNLSVGLNAALLFGQLDYSQAILFDDSLNFYNTLSHNEMTLRDVVFNVGFQYKAKLSKLENDEKDKLPIYMTVGAYGAPPIRVDAFVSKYSEATVPSVIDGSPIPVDTTSSPVFNQYERVTLPATFGAGVTFGNESTWTAGIDFHYENWKNFKSPINNQNLVNDWKVKVGGQIIPKYDGPRWGQKIEYRLGAHFGKTRINLENTALPDFGMSFGLGLPFTKRSTQSRALSKLNLTFEFGKLGLEKENVLKENYYQLTLGYSLSDLWFIKRKFD